MIFGYAKIAMVVVIVGAVGGGYMYVKTLQADLATSKANNMKLEASVAEQKEVIEQQLKDIKAITKANQELSELSKRQDKSINNLKEKFKKVNASGKKRDLGKLAEDKPKLVQRVFTKATKNALRCTEIAMGAPLTEKEKNATKRSQINPECPDLANPSYVPYSN